MATYTKHQLTQYFDHISYPRSEHPESQLRFLTELQRHHLARVSFDSIALHYSPHRLLSLDAEDLFQKIVLNGRGGYCMEVNAFFAAVLRSIGFSVYSAGGRVKHDRWNHMVNIVTIDGAKFLVDVGFGSKEPVQPMLLQDGFEFTGIAPVTSKLELKHLPQHSNKDNQSQLLWVYSAKTDEKTGWEELYSFTEVEFFPEDFEVMNYFVMTRPQSYFVQSVLAYRAIMDDSGSLVGELILHNNYVKRISGGDSEILEQLQNEEQRVEALEKYFKINLTEKEKKAIKGLASELKEGK